MQPEDTSSNVPAEPPVKRGHFVWCNYPTEEEPGQPAARPHMGYCAAVVDVPDKGPHGVMVFTTTQPMPTDPSDPRYWKTKGTISFDEAEAKALGQNKAFTLDSKRVAILPLTQEYFPGFGRYGHGIKGQADPELRDKIDAYLERTLSMPGRIVAVGPARDLLDAVRKPDLAERYPERSSMSRSAMMQAALAEEAAASSATASHLPKPSLSPRGNSGVEL